MPCIGGLQPPWQYTLHNARTAPAARVCPLEDIRRTSALHAALHATGAHPEASCSAAVVTHAWGIPAHMDDLAQTTEPLALIEDASHGDDAPSRGPYRASGKTNAVTVTHSVARTSVTGTTDWPDRPGRSFSRPGPPWRYGRGPP